MRDLVLQKCRLDGRYDIRQRLGRGSYAEVFAADDLAASPQSAHKSVVIKALNVFLQNDLDSDLERTLVENFQNEAIALDRVRHPNILSRLGHGTAKDLRGTVFHYLVLEYLPGGDLAKYCRERRLTVSEALSFLEQICAGLGNAHRHGIIHRDIKPQNLLLTSDHKIVKIADFGVARSTGSDNPITRVGTNVYAPPEHSPLFAGKTGSLTYSELTPAADIYSLAKTSYVMFTGESPRVYSNQPIMELPSGLRSRPWALKLSEVLKKATQDDPRDRYQDVYEFWGDLADLAAFPDTSESGVPTHVATRNSGTPQPQVARGFSPLAPVKPAFDTSRKLKLQEVARTGQLTSPLHNPRGPLIEAPRNAVSENLKSHRIPLDPPKTEPVGKPPRKPKRLLRAGLTFGILLLLFAGSLFATYNYLMGRPLFSGIGYSSLRTGKASTDINLRPAPSTSNQPIGIVTKGSEVQIVRTSNNWHEVVIIRHGRPKEDPSSADRGWVYGNFIVEDK